MSYTFTVSDKKSLVTNLPSRTESFHNVLKNRLKSDYEQKSETYEVFSSKYSSNIIGVSCASFNEHRRLVLDPDSIWSTIERGLSQHIKKNSESLRKQFVNFEGKATIEIRRDNFVKGKKNDWESCFDEFSEKIGGFIGDKKDLIVGSFSTTQPIHRLSSEIILMDSMSKYFHYSIMTLCCIPAVTLMGSVDDWELIKNKVKNFKDFNLDWWLQELFPVLDEFISASKGSPNIDFWKSWYNESGGSGTPSVSGHVVKLYPYFGSDYNLKQNLFNRQCRVTLEDFPEGFSEVPFTWNYFGNIYPMQFAGGIFGIVYTSDGAVKPGFGWAVKDASIPI